MHGLFEFDVGVAGAFSSQVADGSEAGHQRCAQMIGGARDAQRQAFVRHLIVPGSFVVGVQHNVRMAFDKAGHQRRAGEFDYVRAYGVDARRGSGGVDTVAFYEDQPIVMRRFAVEDVGGLQQSYGFGDRGAASAALRY